MSKPIIITTAITCNLDKDIKELPTDADADAKDMDSDTRDMIVGKVYDLKATAKSAAQSITHYLGHPHLAGARRLFWNSL